MRLAILTSGGDAPGMNAAIRSVVRSALNYDIEVYGVERGYQGLMEGDMLLMNSRSVSGIVQRGGTILRTARSPEFVTYEGQRKAAEELCNRKITNLVVIGGDGSFRGAKDLYDNFGINVVGIPGTIDNDLAYTDFTIGFDTAVNTCIMAINNLRDTMSSHERVVIVEVMGRKCGDIALYSAIAGGAEIVMVPEKPVDYDDIVNRLITNKRKGKQSEIIILAEGAGKTDDVIIELKKRCELSFRGTNIGYIQRGGAPTMADRVLAARLGLKAVELVSGNKKQIAKVVGICNNQIIDMDISKALEMKHKDISDLYNVHSITSK